MGARPLVVALTDDNYHSLAELVGSLGQDLVMVEGFLQAQGQGMTWTYTGSDSRPVATDGGQTLAAAQTATFGPARSPDFGWRLRGLWVRNTTPGANVTVVLNASLV